MLIAARNAMLAGGSGDSSEYWGMYCEAEAANVVVDMAKSGSPPAVSLEYSTDGSNWTAFDSEGGTTPITLANIGDRVYFRAGQGGNTRIATSTGDYYYFTLSGRTAAGGNIMSLLNADNQSNVTLSTAYSFYGLFQGCTSLTTAPALPATTLSSNCYYYMFNGCSSLTTAPALPATTLSSYCYRSMFNGCSSLTTAPALPATTLSSYCYYYMFRGCSSLTTAPALPATTLSDSCYRYMFNGCTSLTTAPALPATTLSSNCYRSMFQDCSSLTTAPALPATTLSDSCYRSMFNGCSSLTTAEVAFTAWSPSNATTNWMRNVSASGTFICPAALGTNETITRGDGNCPSGWTVVNT